MDIEKEEEIVTCPVCGSKRLKVGQFTYNTQEYDQEQKEWSDSNYHSFDEGDKLISVFCQGCSEKGVDTDLTKLAVEAGWDIYDEDSFKLIPRENAHEDDMERVPAKV
jgi:hypothetical protein